MRETEIAVQVNGVTRRARVEPRLTLADFIRERCHLTGTHLGCEHGVCGACTVLIDGAAVQVMSGVRGPGRRCRGHDDRGHRRVRRRAVAGAGGVPRPPRTAVRVLHARASSCR